MTTPMAFYRRPQLAGRNITRLAQGMIRGDVRRHDPDGTSTVPYFPGLTAGLTLLISVDGIPYTVTFTNDGSGHAYGLQNVLNNINSVLTTHGLAFDSYGTVGLQTQTLGAFGSVQVTGGTAAAILGYNISGKTIRSTGGDIPSNGVGNVGNWFGIDFPNLTDNVTQDIVTRAAGRLAANTDVLYSDSMKGTALLQKVGNVTGNPITGQSAYGYVTPTSTLPVFTGYGFLSNSSVKEDLSTYFQLIDTVTKQQAISRVVAVVRGTPSGAPPYANTASWSALDGGSVLGQSLQKDSYTISAISDGNQVYCSGATFSSTDGVVVGDLAKIVGGTNLNPWSNDGLKWVVESVIDDQHLLLRPMSMAELALYSTVPTEEQPVLELNDTISGGQVYGTLQIYSGTYASGVNLVVSPPVPAGATYELWAASPGRFRLNSPAAPQAAATPALRSLSSNLTPLPDAILSGATFTVVSTNLVIALATVRWHGQVYSIPAQTILKASTANGTYYVYFNSTTGVYTLTSTATDVFGAAPKGPYIGQVSKNSGTFVILSSGEYPISFSDGAAITVGANGQFQTLQAALDYVGIQSAAFGEGGGGASGAFDHAEILLLESLTVPTTLTISGPDTTIRSVAPSMVLTFNGSGSVFNLTSSGANLKLENLTIAISSGTPTLVYANGGSILGNVNLTNVVLTLGSVSQIVYCTTNVFGISINQVIIDRCNIPWTTSVIQGSTISVYIDRSTLNAVFSDSQQQMFAPNTGPGTWGSGAIDMRRTTVTGMGTSALSGCISDTVTNTINKHHFVDCYFDNSGGGGSFSTFIVSSNATVVTGCTFTSNFSSVYSSTHADSRFERNHVDATFAFCSTTSTLLRGSIVDANIITMVEGSVVTGTVIQAAQANYNRISGVASIGIDLVVDLGHAQASNNLVSLIPGVHTLASTGIRSRIFSSRISGNAVLILNSGGTFTSNTCILLGNGSLGTPITGQTASNSVVDANYLVPAPSDILVSGIGISMASTCSNNVVSNNIVNSSNCAGVQVDGGSTATHKIIGNILAIGSNVNTAMGVYFVDAATGQCLVSGNLITMGGSSANCIYTVSTLGTNSVTGNILLGGGVGNSGFPFNGDLTDNRCSGPVFTESLGTQLITSNKFESTVSVNANSSVVEFQDNYIAGAFTLTNGSLTTCLINDNIFANVVGSFTISNATFSNNKVSSDLTLINVNGVENYVDGDLATSGTCNLDDFTVTGTLTDAGTVFNLSNSSVSGVTTVGSNSMSMESCTFTNSVFLTGTGTLTFTDCSIDYIAESTNFYALSSTGDNATLIIQGGTFIATGSISLGAINITANTYFRAQISGAYFYCQGNYPTSACINVGGNASNFKLNVLGNTIYNGGTVGIGVSNGGINVVMAAGGTTYQVLISGNDIVKWGGHCVSISGGTGNFVASGNMMSQPSTLLGPPIALSPGTGSVTTGGNAYSGVAVNWG